MLSGRLALALAAALVSPAAPVAAPKRYAAAIGELERFIAREMHDKRLPAVSVALVDDQQTVWEHAFGDAGPSAVFRVGSVSHLFTAIALMQLVERGELGLDEPVRTWVPDFRPGGITLRQLLAHRSGLVREPPAGHYFDPAPPPLAACVARLSGSPPVYPPGTRTKYSNAGVMLAGYVLERIRGEPFADAVRRSVLEPLGMRSSTFGPAPPGVPKGWLWSYDGRSWPAPTFELGIAPAGNLYSTAGDLARFLSALFAGGRGVLRPETLEEMWTPRFGKPGEPRGFGVGFSVSKLDGLRRVGHGGAVYGFATDLAALPERKLGAVALTTVDSANSVVERITAAALRLMLAARDGRPSPVLASPAALAPDRARALAGRYRDADRVIELIESNGELYLMGAGSTERVRLRQLGDDLVTDDRLDYGRRISPARLRRLPDVQPPAAPAAWAGLIGEYGWDHDVLYILERAGRLTALIEWYDYGPLEHVSGDVYRFPDTGLYPGETLTFRRDGAGRAGEARVGGVVFARRLVGPESGQSFRIQPRRPVDELRRAALAAKPPAEKGRFRLPDLVSLTELDATIRLDIRYAGMDNFLGTPVYPVARALMQRPAAEALVRAHRKLRERGYGLLIHDAYRPWHVTKIFWEATPEDKRIFVADPSEGSRHNRGCAVDLTLYELATGRAVEMPGVYDEMSPRSYPDYPGGTELQRWRRGLLRRAMEEQGFQVFDVEWWHFDYRDWRQYPILNVPLDQAGN